MFTATNTVAMTADPGTRIDIKDKNSHPLLPYMGRLDSLFYQMRYEGKFYEATDQKILIAATMNMAIDAVTGRLDSTAGTGSVDLSDPSSDPLIPYVRQVQSIIGQYDYDVGQYPPEVYMDIMIASSIVRAADAIRGAAGNHADTIMAQSA